MEEIITILAFPLRENEEKNIDGESNIVKAQHSWCTVCMHTY